MPICYVKPVIDLSVRQLCYQPYPNHPKGCPNYGKRDTCPPKAPFFDEIFDLNKPILAVWVSFDLTAHRTRMLKKHPNWTRRQQDCCLYWQGSVNKRLRINVAHHITRHVLFDNNKFLIVTYVPEAMAVNVTETMKNAGVELEWPPENKVIKVAFIGCPACELAKRELSQNGRCSKAGLILRKRGRKENYAL